MGSNPVILLFCNIKQSIHFLDMIAFLFCKKIEMSVDLFTRLKIYDKIN